DDEKRRPGDFDAVLEGVARPVNAGKRRQQCVMRIDETATESLQESRSDKFQETGGHDKIGLMLRNRAREGAIPVRPCLKLSQLEDERRYSGVLGSPHGESSRAIGSHGDHLRSVARMARR